MLEFPDLGSERRVRLWPDVEADDPRAEVFATFELVGAGTARSWLFESRGIRQRCLRRLVDLRKGTSKDDAPELWGDLTLDEVAADEERAAELKILHKCLVRIEGVSVGGRDISEVKERTELVDLVDRLGLLEVVSVRGIEAQSPSAAQLLAQGP